MRYLILFCLIAGCTSADFNPYVVEQPFFFPTMPTNADNLLSEEGVALGRMLFYDPILSGDSSVSCSSCHRQKSAFSDAPRSFSTGISHNPGIRNTMPLFNLAWYPALFWDGRASSIENQVAHPLKNADEMGLDWQTAITRIERSTFYPEAFEQAFPSKSIDSTTVSLAIAQFLRTLISNRSKYDRVIERKERFTEEEQAGYVLVNDMTKGACIHCHSTDSDALGTKLIFSNNGLDEANSIEDFTDGGLGSITGKDEDYGKFKAPSLRNLGFTAPYMHDGRFTTLEEVIEFYHTGVKSSPTLDSRLGGPSPGMINLSPIEKKQIEAFLLTLNDSLFISDPRYSNPFANH